ncbi:MAG: mevalonate kinase [Pseudomonadota bacterium]
MKTITASAPGSVMITGEHAVVYGHPAVVCAIEQRVTVTATRRTDSQVHISSSIADDAAFDLAELPKDGPYRFVLQVVATHKDHLNTGIDIQITSDINPTLGLGSSSAVTIAALGAVRRHTVLPTDQIAHAEIHSEALSIIRAIQGRGSGADLAAGVYGGMLSYQLSAHGDEAIVAPLPIPPQLSLAYCGYKTPTADVLAQIADRMAGNEEKFEQLYGHMGKSASELITAAKQEDWDAVGAAMADYQTLMVELGVSDTKLDELVTSANSNAGTLGAKISGSGLGDCVIALGDLPDGYTPVTVAQRGLEVTVHE